MRSVVSLSLTALAILPSFTQARTWTSLANISIGTLQEHVTLLLSPTQLATVGGLVSNGSTTNLLLLYDIPTNTWKQGAPVPNTINHANAAVHDGKLFVLGGLSGASGWPATSNSWVYDPQKDSWSPLAPVPSSAARGAAGTGIYNGTIYLGGGILALGGPTVDIVSAYEIASNKWIDLPAAASRLPEGRDHTGTVQIGSKLYITGGRENGATNTKDTVFILDMANVSAGWKTANGKMPTARGGLAAAAVGHRIYTFGGEGNTALSTGVFNQTEVYDTISDTWERLTAMELPRHGTSAVSVGGKVYIPGGAVVQGAGGTQIFDAFTPLAGHT